MKKTITTHILIGLVFAVAVALIATSAPARAMPPPTIIPYPQAVPNLVYNGYNQIGVPWGEGYMLSGTWQAANAGNYMATATLLPGYLWPDMGSYELNISWSIQPQQLSLTPIPDRTYDGTVMTIPLSGPGWTVVGGIIFASEAGAYTIQVMPAAPNYVWPDGTTAIKYVTWNILRKPIPVPTAAGPFIYDGTLKVGIDPNPGYEVMNGSGTSAGYYSAVLTLNSNHCWEGGSISQTTVSWEIRKATVDFPVLSLEQTYNGDVLRAVEDGPGYGLGGQFQAISAGNYSFVISLSDPWNTVWSDGGPYFREIFWRIIPRSIVPPAANTPQTWTGSELRVADPHPAYTFSGTPAATAAGSYTCSAVLTDKTNTIWSIGGTADISLIWVIEPKPVAVPYPPNGPFTYDGTLKVGIDPNPGYAIENGSGTNAGNYEAVLTLSSGNYVWEGHGTAIVSIGWYILPKTIPVPSAVGPLTWDGSLKTGLTAGEGYNVSGGTGTDVGNYTATATLLSGNYVWENGSSEPVAVSWAILPRLIAPPEILSPQTWTGEHMYPAIPNPGSFLMGDTSGTVVGSYSVTVILEDKANTAWTTGGTEDIHFDWYIVPLLVTPPAANTPQVYTGGELRVNSGPSPLLYSLSGSATATDAGDYTAIATLTDKENTVWSTGGTGDLALFWIILPKSIAQPSAAGPFTYDGTEKTGLAAGEGYSVSGGVGTNAGDFTALATLLNGNYVWADGTSDPVSVPWFIAPKLIPPPDRDLSQVYTGAELRVAADGEGYSLTGIPAATNAGYYECFAVLDDKANTAWGDVHTPSFTFDIDFSWSIEPVILAFPTASGTLTYDGTPKTGLADGEGYTVTGGTGTDAGSYTAIATLISGNYIWEDGTSASVNVSWSILRAALPLSSPLVLPAVTYTGLPFTPELTFVNSATGFPLAKGTDYVEGWMDNVNAGDFATAYADGQGNWIGSSIVVFRILPAPLPEPAPIPDQVYTGGVITPDVGMVNTITDPDVPLVQDADYTLSYENNLNAGTATVTVTGRGNWTGQQTANFTILPRPVALPSAALSQVYTGSILQVAPDGLDYLLQGAYSATDTGSYSAWAVLRDKANTAWTNGGTTDIPLNWEITRKPIPMPTANGPFDYDGTEKTGVSPGEGYHFTTGTLTEVNAGSYTTGVRADINYVFTDGTSNSYLHWSIRPARLPAPAPLPDVTYNGLPFTPDVAMVNVIPDPDVQLVQGADYTLVFENNLNAGMATVTVTGRGNWKESQTVSFAIKSAPFPSFAPVPDQTYTGLPIRPELFFLNPLTPDPLVMGIDFLPPEWKDNVNAGTAVVTFQGAGNYTGSSSATFSILRAPLPLTAPLPGVIYTGLPFTPDVAMVNANTEPDAPLVKDTDYTLSYSNNVNAGMATVTITGIGNWTGTAQGIFSIDPAFLPESDWYHQPPQTFTGLPLTPDVMMENPATQVPLVLGTDYTLLHEFNINVGGARIIIRGIENYYGSHIAFFNILPAPLPASAALPDVTYTGLPFTPDIVMANENLNPAVPLLEDADYTLAWVDNVGAGTATVTATGMGNWTGTQTAVFDILPAPLPAPALLPDVVYNGLPFTPDVAMVNANTDPDAPLVKDTDYTLSYVNNINVGTAATVTVTGIGNWAGTGTATFSITPAALPTIAPLPDVVYTGLPFTPDVAMVNANTDPDAPLVKDTDYTLSYANNINVGTATITAKGIGNWAGTGTAIFSITPATPTHYNDNTAVTLGFRFRDLRPDLTDKWYMFTPVDLSRDGEQLIPIIASNLFRIGNVRVVISGGSVRISYEFLRGVRIESAFLCLFPSLNAVNTVETEDLADQESPFNKDLSIAEDLGSDTTILLYARFVVDYHNELDGITRFYPTSKESQEYLEALNALMN